MNPWVLLSLSATALLLVLNLSVLLRPPPHKGLATAVRAGLFCHLLFALGDFSTYLVATPTGYEFSVMVLYSGLVFVGPTWWLISHRYAESTGHPMRWASPLVAYLPLAISSALFLALWSNPLHEQFVAINPGGRNTYHWIWWVHTLFNYSMGLAATAVYITLLLRAKTRTHRLRISFMMGAYIVVTLASVTYVASPEPLPFDPTAIAFGLCGLLYLAGVYQTGQFAISRVAIGNILDQQPNGLLVSDMAGALVYWNPRAEELLDVRVETLQASLWDWVSPRLLSADLKEHPDPPSAQGATIYHLRSDPARCLSIRLQTIRSYAGRIRGRCYLIEDLTGQKQQELEQEQLQEQISQTQKLEGLGLLAGGIAHDFNNLLLAIRGNTELALNEVKAGKDPRQRLDNLMQATDRAASLTHNLLTYAGQAPSKTTRVDLSQLVTQATQLLQTTALHGNSQLVLNLQDDLWVEGDHVQLGQVLMNLALNALEASPDHRSVTLSTGVCELSRSALTNCLYGRNESPGTYVWLEVQDAGCGIPEENLKRVFDPFFSTKDDGHGLGLAAVLGIVRKHAGALEVYSSTQGVSGTRIRIYLPRATRTELEAQQSGSSIAPRVSTVVSKTVPASKGTVLVVDDEHIARDVSCRFLRNAGYDVVEADTAERAIELAEQLSQGLCLILLDVVMPGMNGPEALPRFNIVAPDVPVVFMSGHPRGHLDHSLPNSVAIDYLEKPFLQNQLLQKVSDHARSGAQLSTTGG